MIFRVIRSYSNFDLFICFMWLTLFCVIVIALILIFFVCFMFVIHLLAIQTESEDGKFIINCLNCLIRLQSK